jgi:fatty-acyl-CoA synthase
MFHCNGWCFPWAMAANAGASVCLRKVEPQAVFDAIRAHRVTHMCGAPIVYAMLMNAPAEVRGGIEHLVHGLVAGAAPPAAMIEGMERIGFDITHVYGLTEVMVPPRSARSRTNGPRCRLTSAPASTPARAWRAWCRMRWRCSIPRR